MLINKVKKSFKKYAMLDRGDGVVVAVSGGPDSVCLLSVLIDLAKDLELSLHVAHLDHMFRGKESADEALFVADLAKKSGIPATIEKIDVPAFCAQRGLSAQAGAREVRYRFLAEVAAKINATRIATGHTATDQAETFLLRLLRGAGVSGLSAIPPVRGIIIRPLIEVTREEVLEYLRMSGLEYVSDPSNAKPVYTRNRIRMELLPALRRFNPRIVETLASEAAFLREENEALETCLKKIADGAVERKDDGAAVKREAFTCLPPAFSRRLFKKAVESAGMESSRLSSVQIDEAVAFMCAAQTGRVMRLPYGLQIEREYDKFVIRFGKMTERFCHTLAVPGITTIHELGLEVECLVQDKEDQNRQEGGGAGFDESRATNYFWQALFDYDKIGPLLKIRNRRPGDWFRPSGMEGKSKKLQDYFVDEKVPRRSRDVVPLLVSAENILWVIGFRTDERFQPSAGTKRRLLVIIRESTTNP